MSEHRRLSREAAEAILKLRFPQESQQRLQRLMDLNNEGRLSEDEREEIARYVQVSELLSLLHADALKRLGRQPE